MKKKTVTIKRWAIISQYGFAKTSLYESEEDATRAKNDLEAYHDYPHQVVRVEWEEEE